MYDTLIMVSRFISKVSAVAYL